MLPKAIAVAVLSSVAIAAGGCGGDSDSSSEATFRSAFKKRFATAPSALLWYHRITGMEVADGRLEVATDLDPDTDDVLNNARAYAEAICQGVTNFSFEGHAEGIETTSVTSVDGVPLARCRLIWPWADSDAEAKRAVDITAFRAEFKKRWAVPPNVVEPVWYRHVTAINMGEKFMRIKTDLGPGQNELASMICSAAATLALDRGELGDEIKGVLVSGSVDRVGGGCG